MTAPDNLSLVLHSQWSQNVAPYNLSLVLHSQWSQNVADRNERSSANSTLQI
jgi:hypothetical protein